MDKKNKSNKYSKIAFRLCDLVSKITYSDRSGDELIKSVVQNTKNNKELTLIKNDASSGKNSKFWNKYSDKKIEGIMLRKSEIKTDELL